MERELPTSFLMFLHHRAAEDRIFAALAAAGFGDITRAQGRLLAGMDEGGTRLVTLAARARIAKQTAVALVDRLVAAGYVERVPDPVDGRARLVCLTPRGEELIPVARSEEKRIEADWAAHLGGRRMDQLRSGLERLRELTDPGD
ncbi:MAG: MarR family transcriptional regulator [Propionibacteriaceae bacterium]|nr:MarR family transcriptional regulator [Propionibacteriaceae bacterium]